jgi:nucleoid DNA-binding protein
MTLTKKEIVDLIITKTALSPDDASKFMQNMIDLIAKDLSNGKHVKIHGFGSFTANHKKERIGRNPKTKEEFVITARKSISFKASNSLREMVAQLDV